MTRPGGRHRTRCIRGPWRLLTAALTVACGARTGLGVPDAAVAPDAPAPVDVTAPPDLVDAPEPVDEAPPPPPPDVCAPATVPLVAGRAEVMFVLDRSTSMTWALEGPTAVGTPRWVLLLNALRGVLPRYDAAMDMGLLLFPGTTDGEFCSASPAPQIAPRPSGAAPVVAALERVSPSGRTPTADALASVRRYFAARVAPGRVRVAVLATDGAPNCNDSLDARTCVCTGGTTQPGQPPACTMEPGLCLDDLRTVQAVEALAREGVPTYVIGIDGAPSAGLARVLTQLAAAGGRPNPLDPARGYYSALRPEDLPAAFDRIQRSIVSCSFSLAARAPEGRELRLTLDGAAVPHDPTGREGWAWSDDARRSVVLAGAACARAQGDGHRLELTALCP